MTPPILILLNNVLTYFNSRKDYGHGKQEKLRRERSMKRKDLKKRRKLKKWKGKEGS